MKMKQLPTLTEYRVYLFDKEGDSQVYVCHATDPKTVERMTKARFPGCDITHIDEA